MQNEGELKYLELLEKLRNKVKETGFNNQDRTGVGTASTFGEQIRFDLSKSFPLFTHKQVFMRGIFEELMWFLRGETNISTLVQRDVNIWNEWRYKDFKESMAKAGFIHIPSMESFIERVKLNPDFAKRWGDIGKGYGHQWRNFGEITIADAKVLSEHSTTVGRNTKSWGGENRIRKGFDQISWVVKEIKNNPTSRRLIVSGWNPHDIDSVDLPPCHTLFQFFVGDGKLSCQLYQRSADLLLGVPFNIASYALLTHLVALECGLDVGEFIWVGGDCHVYSNQFDGLNEILDNREPLHAPQIKINKRDSLFDYEWSDIKIIDYQHLGKVEMPVAV